MSLNPFLRRMSGFLLLLLFLPVLSAAGEEQDTVRIIGVGDIMLGTGFPETSLLPPGNNCSPLLSQVTSILSSADVTFGNLEGSLLDNGPVAKSCKNPSVCYAFRMPEKFADCLVENGFDLLSIANNHIGDFGEAGIRRTMSALDERGIRYAGLLRCPDTLFEKNGVKYGFCAFAPNSATVKLNDVGHARKIVRKLAGKSDIVIVSFHGGAEGPDHQHVTRKSETFYGENRGNVYQFAHAMIDAGADVIFGHGPHVTRAMEIYKNRLICYSLGNFCTYGPFNLKGPNGIAPIVQVTVSKKGEFRAGKVWPVMQQRPGGVRKDPDRTVIKKLNELMHTDFPEQNLEISAEGDIIYKNL